jgi:AcrR family transcriptional regulator
MPKIGEAARTARRDQITAAALACFARAGYHATTMADVAAQAEMSKGTPYLYFESKQALFIALHEQWDCGTADRVNAAVGALTEAESRSPRRILHVIAAAIAAQVVEETETCRILMEARALAAHEPAIAAAVRAADIRAHEQLEGLIAAGVQAGEWPAGTDPALAARLFTAGLYGLMAQWHLAPGSFSWPAAAAALAGGPAPVRGPRTPAPATSVGWYQAVPEGKIPDDPGNGPRSGRGPTPASPGRPGPAAPPSDATTSVH